MYTDWMINDYGIERGNTDRGNAEGDYCPADLAFLFTEEAVNSTDGRIEWSLDTLGVRKVFKRKLCEDRETRSSYL